MWDVLSWRDVEWCLLKAVEGKQSSLKPPGPSLAGRVMFPVQHTQSQEGRVCASAPVCGLAVSPASAAGPQLPAKAHSTWGVKQLGWCILHSVWCRLGCCRIRGAKRACALSAFQVNGLKYEKNIQKIKCCKLMHTWEYCNSPRYRTYSCSKWEVIEGKPYWNNSQEIYLNVPNVLNCTLLFYCFTSLQLIIIGSSV